MTYGRTWPHMRALPRAVRWAAAAGEGAADLGHTPLVPSPQTPQGRRLEAPGRHTDKLSTGGTPDADHLPTAGTSLAAPTQTPTTASTPKSVSEMGLFDKLLEAGHNPQTTAHVKYLETSRRDPAQGGDGRVSYIG
eukprot:gene950-2216_t